MDLSFKYKLTLQYIDTIKDIKEPNKIPSILLPLI